MAHEDIEDKRARLDALLAEIEADTARRILADPNVRAAREQQRLTLERELASAAGIEYADELPLDVGIGEEWHLIAVGLDPSLFCGNVSEGFVTLLRFKQAEEFRLSGTCDEADASPLAGRGLGVYGLFVVRNSEWKRGLLNAISNRLVTLQDAWWSQLEHFIVRGKGGELACLARGVECRTISAGIEDIRQALRAFSAR